MDQSQPTTVFMSAPSGGVGRLSSESSASRTPRAAAADHHVVLDPFLDELMSMGSHDVSDLRLHDSHSIGSPMNRSAASPSQFTLSPTWRLTNPVHMEIQENAKLPTFNLDVDRTGSSTYPRVPLGLDYMSSPSSHDASATEENGWSDQKKKKAKEKNPSKRGSLAERFLQHSTRQSLHSAYAQAGALREHQDRTVGHAAAAQSSAQSSARNSRAGSIADEKKAEHGDHQVLFTGGPLLSGWDVDPTPLSEIQRKHQSEEHCSTTGYRKLQLPIPFLPPSPGAATGGGDQSPGRQFAAELASTDAIATAAAIASQAALAGSRQRGPSDPPLMLLPDAQLTNDDATGVKRQSTSMSMDRSSSQRRRLNGASSPTHDQSLLKTASTPQNNGTTSIERASSQKSQYGFGPKHVVPSVPASLEAAKIAIKPRTDSQPQQPRQNAESKSRRSDSPHGSVSTANQQGTINAGPAYERKKQKAKDARVRLNESIEKLSIAISFAGTQSKQRLDQWNSMMESREDNSGVDTDSNRLRSVLQTCVHNAEDAKKWDRPSFVATAALVIESLNAQCEVLMRELSVVHSTTTARTNGHHNGGAAGHATNDMGVDSHGLDPGDLEVALDAASEALAAAMGRPLQEAPVSVGKEIVEWGGSKITSRIAKFLDPLSLGRCNLVSPTWRRDFSNSEAWCDMSIQRFGHYNVRQWRGKLEDEDEGITCKPFTLYNSMDRSNTMPHFSRDGLFLLGEACLPGKVSVWTFLVERSNGETHRSVLRPDNVSGSGTYMSLPVVELRSVIQNTGSNDGPVLIREQLQTVDASTRRRGVEMKEIDWDERFQRRLLNLDGTPKCPTQSEPMNAYDAPNIMCGLKLFEAVVVATFIHAKGCSTMSKFVQKSNYTKFHVQIQNGTTIPLVVTFPRDLSHHLEH